MIKKRTGDPIGYELPKVDCITGAAIALIVVAGTMQYSATRSAANRAESEAQRNAELIRLENKEAARKMELANKQAIAETRARAGASGMNMSSGSTQGYLKEMKSVFNAEINWLRKSGTMQSYNEILKGQGVAAGLRADANVGLVRTASKAFSAGA